MTVEAVVFDIGNVLLEWHPERYFDRTIGPERRKAMFADVDLHAMNDRIDLGEGFKDVIYATAEAYPDWRAEIRDWYDNWIAARLWITPGRQDDPGIYTLEGVLGHLWAQTQK